MIPQVIRFADLKAKGLVTNRETLGRWIREKGFPPGKLIGPNTRVWTDQEINDWWNSRPVHSETEAA